MRKRDELREGARTCMNSARDDEMVFVLLGRDAAAPAAILAWIDKRIELGLNVETDPKIVEARACAETMYYERVGDRANAARVNAEPSDYLPSAGDK